MLEKGKIISDYVLVEKIGHGGFGDVWLAEKRTPLSISQVALKFFRPAEINPLEIETVRREIEVWQKISGLPNIISVIEADYVEDYIYIVSEYADGGSLQKWLAASGGKAGSVERAVKIILEILNGLDYLHRTGFIHRDLKPANILIRKGTFCLADFGVSREIKTHSVTQRTAGTYNYMPPEAFNKSPTVSPATDIWAVGVIFQELLTGKLPFAQTEIPSLMYAILHEEPDEMPDDIPPPLRAVVRQSLQKKREDRFATAEEMIDALKQAQIAATAHGDLQPIDEPSAESNEISNAAILDSPKVSEATIYDESFVAPANISPAIAETPVVQAAAAAQTAPILPDAKHAASVQPPARLRRNKLIAAGVAGLLLLSLGVLLISAGFFRGGGVVGEQNNYYERGLKCAAQEDFDCAAQSFGKVIENEPNNVEAYRHRAAVLYVQGNFAQAIPDYNRAIELDPNDAGSFYGRGTALLNSGDFDGAIADYGKSVALNSQDAKSFYSRGLAFYRKKQFEKAVADFSSAIKLDPNYAEAYNNRGNAYDELGKTRQAIADYTKAVEIYPNYALAFGNRGTSLARAGDYRRAVEDLTKSIALDPALASSYFNRANVYYLQKNTPQALEDYNKYIELAPDNSLAFSNRAAIVGAQGNYAQAIEDYNRAVEINPQDAQNYFNRAAVYEKLGNREKAESDRQRYRDLTLKR